MPRLMNRRRMLKGGVGALAGVEALGALSATTAQADTPALLGGLEGAWLINRTDVPPGDLVEVVWTFPLGGVFTGFDYDPPGPTYLGAWAYTGLDSFKATVYASSTVEGPPPQILTLLTATIEGTFGAEKIQGSFSATITDGSGNVLASGPGTFSGKRVAA